MHRVFAAFVIPLELRTARAAVVRCPAACSRASAPLPGVAPPVDRALQLERREVAA